MYAVDAPVPAFKSRFFKLWKYDLSQTGNLSSVCWFFIVQGKGCCFLPNLGGGPPSRTTGFSFIHDILQRKPAMFKHDVHVSIFFIFFLAVCYNWWKSIQGCFPISLCCAVVPAVWASSILLLWRRTVVLWIRRGDTMLSLCVSYSFPFFLSWTKLLKRGAWALHWWLDANAK